MTDVPVVDLSGWSSSDASARARVVRAFDEAASGPGFFHLVGHGVSAERCGALRAVADEFFALAEEEKALVAPARPTMNRGWTARGSESLAYTLGEAKPADLVEAFVAGNDHAGDPRCQAGDPYFASERHRAFAPNRWPARPPGFAAVVLDYFAELRTLSFVLLDVAAAALDLEPGWFRARTDRATETLRLNSDRRLRDETTLDPGQMALGAHTDYGILTVLLADAGPGLQVVGADGGWHDVVPVDGGFIVNIGDALAVWTNDRWASTIHRVVPSPLPGGPARRSFAFFQDGNHDAVLSCLPSCCSADRPARYAPVTLGAHLQDKIAGGRTMSRVDEGVQTQGDRVQTPRGDQATQRSRGGDVRPSPPGRHSR